MTYVALYRKFRPQTFSLVKGQDHVVRTLKNQVGNGRIGHAYLFTGTRGTGKTSVAKIFAKAINCQNPVGGEPCNECENCKAIMQGNFMDVVEIDAASNTSVDDIRRVIDEIQYTPIKGKYKVYIIDEAHMLSNSAANAFLKTLEEPPEYAVFILATTDPHKLPITILSRCQRYDFKRISIDDLAENLKNITDQENVEIDDKALRYIAKLGEGSSRDAISLLDKCIAFNLGNKINYEDVLSTLGVVDTEIFSTLLRSIANGDTNAALKVVDETIDTGKDLSQFVNDFIWYLRNVLLLKINNSSDSEVLGVSEENMKTLKEDTQLVSEEILLRYVRVLSELINQLRFSPAKQILTEVAIIKLSKPQMESDIASLADRLRQLEDGVQAGNISYTSRQAFASKPSFAPESDIIDIAKDNDDIDFPEFDVYEEQPYEELGYEEPEYEETEQTYQNSPAPIGDASLSFVMEKWDEIVSGLNDRRIKGNLGKCSVALEGNVIAIYPVSEMTYMQVKEESTISYLAKAIKEITGIDANIIVRTVGQKSEIANQTSLESLLGNININIGTEDM